MQKKFIAIAVAAAIAAPMTVAADVTIYGKMHASWDWVDNDSAVAGTDDSDDATGVLRQTRIGFKGSEDLGNGLSAVWQMEVTADNDEASPDNGFDFRNTYVGLKGGWGEVRMGRHDTPYKISTGKLDLFTDTIGDYNNIIGASERPGATTATQIFDERAAQTVAYISPNFNGFHAAIARVSANAPEATGIDDTHAWSLAGVYSNGPFFASLAYESHDNSTNLGTGEGTSTDETDAWKLGLGYSFGNSKVGFVYEDISVDEDTGVTTNDIMERDAWMINFSHKFGANTFKIQYADADDGSNTAAGASTDADNWSVGIDHAFSKRTSVYAIYSSMDNAAGASFTLNSGDDVGTSAYGAGLGSDVDAFSVGLTHTF